MKGDGALDAIDVLRLMQMLPHRYPFLMVDRIVDIAPDGASARGWKNVTINEPFFPGHFPAKPVMPGVLMIEAMAQTAAAFTAHCEGFDMDGKVVFLMAIDNVRFRRPVVPGDRLEMPVERRHKRPPVWKFHARAEVDGETAAQADFTAMLATAD